MKNNNIKKKIKKYLNPGFSLMETLIWVAIVGIFLSLVAFVGLSQIDRAKVKAAKQEMSIYASAIIEYVSTEGKLPTEEEGLIILVQKDYIVSKHKDKLLDPWGNEYIYSLISDGSDFMIKSLGADKQDGGEGTKADIVYPPRNSDDDFGNSEGLDYGSDFDME